MSNHHQLARWREKHNGKKCFMKEHSSSYPPGIYETSALDCFIYILDSSNSSSFTFWSIQFAGSSRSEWTSIWTGNSNATSANGFRYCHKIFMKHPHTYTVIAWKYKRNISWKHKFMKKKNAISERTILLWKRRPVDNFTSIHFPFNKIRQTHSKQQLMTILQISNVFFWIDQ